MTLVAFLDYFILAAHLIVCVLLIVIVLIQGGKGASLSASFGMGSAASAFGARTDSFMTKLTAGAAITFVLTSIGLTMISPRASSITQRVNIETETPAPAASPEVPAVTEAATESPATGAAPETTVQ